MFLSSLLDTSPVRLPAIRVGAEELTFLDLLKVAKSHLCFHLITDVTEIVLLDAAAREHQIQTSDDELQQAVDQFRRDRGLLSARSVEEWLQREGLSISDLETYATHRVRRRKLRDLIAGPAELDAWLHQAASRGDLGYSRIVVDNRSLAAELLQLLQENSFDFGHLARSYSLDNTSKTRGGRMGLFAAEHLSIALRSTLQALQPGQCGGPLFLDGFWQVFRRDPVDASLLADAQLERAQEEILQNWLAARCGTAQADFLRALSSP